MKEKVFLSLGSNLGDKINHLLNALTLMHQSGLKITNISKLYSTIPWGFESANTFYNICVEVHTSLNPYDLLSLTQSIEKSMGREKASNYYEDRVIDIDILFYGSNVLQTKELNIPHHHIQKRLFVLFPLNDIASTTIHPILGLSVKEMLNLIFEEGGVELVSASNQMTFVKHYQCFISK